jgi:hypothetical protein
MISFTGYLEENGICWTGYKRKPGTKPYEKGSCVKEEEIEETAAQQAAVAIAKKKSGKYDAEGNRLSEDEKPWETPNPKKKHKHISAEKIAKARARARAAGRPYPNLVDNMAVMKEDAKGYKSPSGGLTQKGRDHYNRISGGHLKAPVTTSPSELKKGSKSYNRRKSFCARMSGVKGPMKKPNGKPTRKALALRKWNC